MQNAGKVALYETYNRTTGIAALSKMPIELPNGPLPFGFTASSNFGTQVVSTGGSVFVSDQSATQGLVYRFKWERQPGRDPHDPKTFTYAADTLVGTSGPSYGKALGAFADLVAVGEPTANKVAVWPTGNSITTLVTTASTPQGTVSVSVTKNGAGPDPMVTAGNCTTFQQGIQAGVALPICLNVQNTGELVGSSEVCFPNPTGSAGFKVYRCSRRAVCLPLEVKSNDLCCGELTKRTTLTFNPYCVETDGFSDFLATPIPTQTLRDADSDLRPDLVDNCPTTFNPFQADTDNDGIGDVCEATPKPVPVKGIAPALALLLVGVGAFILRRKVLS